MDNEGSSDAASEMISEPIETSVVALEAGLIILQPMEINQQNNGPDPVGGEAPVYVESSAEAEVTPVRKRRKRLLSRKSESPKKPPPPLNNDDDDGSTCSICLDSWETEGDHRLVALKCGHLFGECCIRRWINECPAQSRCCPTCKSKATPREIRNIYAKRVVVIDKSEEYRLQKQLESERTKNVDLQSTLSTLKLEMAVCREERMAIENELNRMRKHGIIHSYNPYEMGSHTSSMREGVYRMAMHKNIDINRDGGCRALTYSRRDHTLIVSQKSTTTLFPGFGVRLISAYTLQPTVYFRMSPKPIRDLSLDGNEELLAAASQDTNAYIYSVTNHMPVATITPSESQIWATSFDKIRSRYLHLGSQQGITYIYDVRNCMAYIEQLTTPGDFSPVIGIVSIPISNDFPFGGFVVCKLQSLWFYEYTGSERIEQTKLIVEGPFVSISFNDQTNLLLISTRLSNKYKRNRLIVANLTKIDQTTVLRSVCTIFGSETQKVMSRSTQINIGNDSLVAGYVQHTKKLSTWNEKNGILMHDLSVEDCILDMCPMYVNNGSFLATLSETKCRIFQLNSV